MFARIVRIGAGSKPAACTTRTGRTEASDNCQAVNFARNANNQHIHHRRKSELAEPLAGRLQIVGRSAYRPGRGGGRQQSVGQMS